MKRNWQHTKISFDCAPLKALPYTILWMNIKLEHCYGQCCDGASAKNGAKKGVAKIIANKRP